MTKMINLDESLLEIASLKKELQEVRASEERLMALTDTSFEAIGLFDENLNCIDINNKAIQLFGYNKQQFKGMHALNLIAKASHRKVKVNLQKKRTTPYEAIARRKDGSTFPALVQGTDINFKGEKVRVTAVRDISKFKAKQLELEKSNAELALIFENSMVGMLLLYGGRTVHKANQRIADILGYETATELIGKNVLDFHLTQQRFEEFGEVFFKALITRDLSQIDYQFRRKDGTAVWCTMCGKAMDTNTPPDLTKGVLWVADDISDRKEAEELLLKLATTDELTGVKNRRHFLEVGEKEFTRQQRYETEQLSLLMLDIDYFKQINDTFGHDVGDSSLKVFASLCESSLREIDILGRLGGEEFAILLPNTGEQQASLVANRICQLIKNHSHHENSHIPNMTVSIGISSVLDENDTLSEMLRRADSALYEAKHKGRNRIQLFNFNSN